MKFKCDDRFLVYKITCKVCNKFYIGQSSRTISSRLLEHRRSINKKDQSSALSEHNVLAHNGESSFTDFTIDIVEQLTNPIETKIAEAMIIDRLRPQLNRRFEMTQW